MINTAILSSLGCFIIENFLSAEECAKLRHEAQRSVQIAAKMVNSDDVVYANQDYRSTKTAQISKETIKLLHERMIALKPEIEQYFKVNLTNCETPNALVYHAGDFFKLHKDQDNHGNSRTRNRQVSIVVFLNSQSPNPLQGCYSGGSLNLYGLVDQPGWEDKGFPLRGQEGLLFAFRSDVPHEVAPVTNGERFTVVNWFY